MEKEITVKSEYNSLEKVLDFLKKESTYECSIDYDSWEIRTDAKGQMEKCIVIKKSAMHGMRMHFVEENKLKATYIIPNKLMHAYFGKSEKRYRNVLEIITGAIKNALLASSQKEAFKEITQVVNKVAA